MSFVKCTSVVLHVIDINLKIKYLKFDVCRRNDVERISDAEP